MFRRDLKAQRNDILLEVTNFWNNWCLYIAIRLFYNFQSVGSDNVFSSVLIHCKISWSFNLWHANTKSTKEWFFSGFVRVYVHYVQGKQRKVCDMAFFFAGKLQWMTSRTSKGQGLSSTATCQVWQGDWRHKCTCQLSERSGYVYTQGH